MATQIEYFLNGKSLGKTKTREGSAPINRIKSAKYLGIKYYDGFTLDNNRLDSRECLFLYSGIMKPLNDFKIIDKQY